MLPAFVVLLCFGCGNNAVKTDEEKNAATAADSMKAITTAYQKELVNLSGNKNIPEILCQGWELQDDLESLSLSSEAEGMMPFRSFYLSADSTYIKDPRNGMSYGRWEFNNAAKTITMQQKNGNRDVYKIGSLAVKELVAINSGIGSITKLKYVSSGKRYANPSSDPYHISNNLWRIAPKKAETDEALRSRLKAFLWFHILFYRDNLAKEEKTISFYGFPTCLKWYAGGIFIIKKEKLPDNWFACFYNKEQALKAYQMMDEIISKKYKWPKGNISWVKKNLSVLEQMYGQM
jgi:hypothetical protein